MKKKIKETNDRVEIYDKENKIRKFPKFIRRLFLKKYYQQGLVQIDSETNEFTVCGDSVKWLENVYIETTSQRRADELMFEYFNTKYPQYKSYIQLF
jgi:hypothetical protein